MSGSTTVFFGDLPAVTSFDAFFDADLHAPVPDDWTALVAQVRGSDRVIAGGRYQDVNCVAVSCILAMVDGLAEFSIPFAFTGDGARFCVPPEALELARAVLLDCQHMARMAFDVDLRIGAVSVSLLNALDAGLRVGKWQMSPHCTRAMFMGDGLRIAEMLIRGSHQFLIQSSRSSRRVDFSGFKWRWQEIPSPSEENISLLVTALHGTPLQKRLVYTEVQHQIDAIYGDPRLQHPVTAEVLANGWSPGQMVQEARIRQVSGGRRAVMLHMARAWPRRLAGRALQVTGLRRGNTDWSDFKHHVHDNTDVRAVDDGLRMVISGRAEQRRVLRSRLDELQASGRIVYGLHVSSAAVINGFVADGHVGPMLFLDGSHGGYAMAAVQLGQQLKRHAGPQKQRPIAIGDAVRETLTTTAAHHRAAAMASGNPIMPHVQAAAAMMDDSRSVSQP
jgi:Protein of unknown function (DUF3095)